MNHITIDKTEILKRYKRIDKYAHKGIQGHALVIGGSYGKIGSICLSSKAAIKTGCGLVTAFVPKCGYEIVQISISEVMVLLNKDFVKWVVIAFVFATPVAYYAMNKWLENFAYKTELSWWIFALAGLLALGIALLTISWQSWKASSASSSRIGTYSTRPESLSHECSGPTPG